MCGGKHEYSELIGWETGGPGNNHRELVGMGVAGVKAEQWPRRDKVHLGRKPLTLASKLRI